jgi:hypothetical protein
MLCAGKPRQNKHKAYNIMEGGMSFGTSSKARWQASLCREGEKREEDFWEYLRNFSPRGLTYIPAPNTFPALCITILQRV